MAIQDSPGPLPARVAPRPLRWMVWLLLPLLALAGSARDVRPAQAQAAEEGRVKVLFLGDDGHHRPWDRARIIMPYFADRGVDVFYSPDREALNEAVLSRYDVLLLYTNHIAISDAQRAALLDFVAGGGGLVAVHCASAAFQNSEEFIRLVGASFKSHGTGTFGTVRPRPEHPAIRGVPRFESWDETYVHQKHNPDRVVLEVRREGEHEEPYTWVRRYGEGRVFYTAWGHDARTWSNPGFQVLLERGTRWAAGDWALELEPPPAPFTLVELETPLPFYPEGEEWGTTGEPIRAAHEPLAPEVSRRLMVAPPGFRVELFAAEPQIVNPIDMAWDERGRLWVLETVDYPNNLTEDRVGSDRLVILEAADGDGRADDVIVFADGLNIPTSLVFANGGVIVSQAPDMLFLKDTDGDDRADVREVLFTGWRTFDTHAGPSNLRYGPDNHIYGAVGYAGFEGEVGGVEHDFAQGYYRFMPDGSRLEYLGRTSNNTWGFGFTEEGYLFGSTANRNPSVFLPIPRRYYEAVEGTDAPMLPSIADRSTVFPLRPEIRQVDQHGRYTAGAGHQIYTARAFPREFWNRAAFVAAPTAHLLGRFELRPDGADFDARNRLNLLASRDPWSAPIGAKVGPDGMVWVSDWYNLVVQHNPTPEGFERGEGNAYETPNRDRRHGRIYRVVHEEAAPRRPPRLDDAAPQELVRTLRHPNMFWRLTAQRLLVERGATDVVPSLLGLVRDDLVDDLGLNAGAFHAIWTLEGLGMIAADASVREAVRGALHHPSAAVRRAALMALPRTPDLLDDMFAAGMLPDRTAPPGMDYTVGTRVMLDAEPQVRLAALLTASELEPSARAGRAVAEVVRVPENVRDRWLADAAAIAGAAHDAHFLAAVLETEPVAEDSVYRDRLAGVVRTVAAHHAASAPAGTTVELLVRLAAADELLIVPFLEGFSTGWPEERPPSLEAEDRARIAALWDELPQAARPLLQALATRWRMPDLFPVS